ncbi:MAG: glycosyltransferase, partial [Chloroflexi bacterium]|nr:glycosyltransferase [Chloroflexota bacterium]
MERAAGDLARLLRTLEPDVVHAHYVRRWGWQAARAGVHPLVVTPWGSDLLRTPWWGLRTRFWNRFALRSADLITVSSEGMRRAAVNAGARAKRVELVNHGVDTTRFSPGPPRATMVEADDAPIIVSPRTVRPLYRQEVVVDAVAAITSSERRPLLVMSARGADPATLTAVRERAAARGIGDRLRILDDVAHDELPDLFRLADVVVSVPDTDSLPLTVLEAMACGTPVVVSDLPAVTPVIGPLDPLATELVVGVGDVGATAVALDRALRLTDAERARLGRALRAFVIRTADYDTNMTRMEALYRRLA